MTVRLIEVDPSGTETALVGTFPSETEAAAEAQKRRTAAFAQSRSLKGLPTFRIVPA